jgi:hypothetical protein
VIKFVTDFWQVGGFLRRRRTKLENPPKINVIKEINNGSQNVLEF